VVIRRGEIYWVDLGSGTGSRPAKMRPVVVVQDDRYNDSRLATTVVAALTSNVDLARLPGNVLVPAVLSGLTKDSVVNATALATVDRTELADRVGAVPADLMDRVDEGLRLVLSL
jgi:mRNA interferase MazF